MKISKNEKMRNFSCTRIILPKIRFLGQKVCPVARSRTDGQTDRQTDRHIFLQPIIKDRPLLIGWKKGKNPETLTGCPQ